MSSRRLRVLLVECGWHSTMDLARGLEDAGHQVTVLTTNGTTARCRHRSVLWMSGPTTDDPQFVPCVERLASEHDQVLPLTEDAMAALWSAGTGKLYPPTEPWQRALLANKHALLAHMAARGIAVPAQLALDPALDLDAVALPVVIKGATGCGGRMVRIVETRAELAAAVARAGELGGAWVAQELIAGPTFLVGGLFDRGRALRIYAGQKIEQHPARTGGAIHLRSLGDPALVELGVRTLAELKWTGFASIDAMRAADGRYVLLEVNPRLWGSLAGAASAGVDLFAPFAELLAGGSPRVDLAFTPGDDCLIFPRYLNAEAHRNLTGVRHALRDLRSEQGRDWLDPRFVVHILRRLYWMKRQSARM